MCCVFVVYSLSRVVLIRKTGVVPGLWKADIDSAFRCILVMIVGGDVCMCAL